MDSQGLRTRYAELSGALAEIEVSSDMAPHIRRAVAGQLDILAADAERNLLPDTKASTQAEVRDDGARFFRQLAMTNSWLDGRDDVTRRWVDRAAELASSDVLRDMLLNEQNALRDSETFAGISALCRQGRVDKARRILEARRKATTDPITRKRIDEVLADPRNLMGPLTSMPPLQTINGIGTMLCGERNRGTDATYVATLCFTVLGLPLFPIRAYLVRSEGENGYRVFGRVPLSSFAFWYRRSILLVPILLALGFWGVDTWESSSYVVESNLLATAEKRLQHKDLSGTLKTLSEMSGTTDAGRGRKLEDLANRTLTAALNGVRGPHDGGTFLADAGEWATRIRRPWAPATEAAAVAAFERAGYGKTARHFLVWHAKLFPEAKAKRADLALKACENSKDPLMLALAAEQCVEAKRPCPPDLLARLKEMLIQERHENWNSDALSYLRAAPDPDQAAPLLMARCEAPWKARLYGGDLTGLPGLPAPLQALIALDGESNLEKRAEGLEKAADPAGLEEPQKSWHRLGSARRLLEAYGKLNERDPIKYPISRMRRWAIETAELAPEDADTRVTALRYLIEDGEYDKVVAIGSRAPGDTRTATLVGIALARSGKLDEAARLLRPIVERDLPEFIKSLQAWEKSYGEKTTSLYDSLRSGSADQSFIARLNSLPKEKAAAEAERWVHQQADRDSYLQALGKKWRQRADVHPAASELAMVELAIGRDLPPGPARQERLLAAEHLFLELRKTTQDDPHQELQLGQVYFWLGKDKEGAAIFDRLEAEGDADVLHQLGQTYRTLSRMDAARRVLEAGYQKGNPKQKQQLAFTRSLSTFDLEDRLMWLKRSDAGTPRIKIDIDQTQAELDIQAGRYEQAIAPMKRAAAYYAEQHENSTTLNNGAIVYQELGRITGDRKHLLESLRLMRKAHELVPENAIVLGNYVDQLEDIGVAALAGDLLRADLLHELPQRSWLDYAVPNRTAAQWAALAKAQPELRRGAELAPKVVVLSPDRDIGYSAQSSYFFLTLDGDGLRRLRESVEARPPAREEDAAKDKAHGRGEWTESERKGTQQFLAAADRTIPALRQAGHAPTLAYALVRRSTFRLHAVSIGMAGQTLDEAVKDAEEALQVFDGPPTRVMIAWVRAEQVAAELAAADKEFARWRKENPAMDGHRLIPLYVRKHPDRLAALLARDSVLRATRACADVVLARGRSPWSAGWAWLDMAGHEARDVVRQELKSNPVHLETERLAVLLNPHHAGDLINAWTVAEACGEKDLANRLAAQARERGLIPLFFTKE